MQMDRDFRKFSWNVRYNRVFGCMIGVRLAEWTENSEFLGSCGTFANSSREMELSNGPGFVLALSTEPWNVSVQYRLWTIMDRLWNVWAFLLGPKWINRGTFASRRKFGSPNGSVWRNSSWSFEGGFYFLSGCCSSLVAYGFDSLICCLFAVASVWWIEWNFSGSWFLVVPVGTCISVFLRRRKFFPDGEKLPARSDCEIKLLKKFRRRERDEVSISSSTSHESIHFHHLLICGGSKLPVKAWRVFLKDERRHLIVVLELWEGEIVFEESDVY